MTTEISAEYILRYPDGYQTAPMNKNDVLLCTQNGLNDDATVYERTVITKTSKWIATEKI